MISAINISNQQWQKEWPSISHAIIGTNDDLWILRNKLEMKFENLFHTQKYMIWQDD